jgi:hypothetical protein
MRFPKTGPQIAIWPGIFFGYTFDYISNEETRQKFHEALKASLPMSMWEPAAFRRWVPSIYAPIMESIAVEHGALQIDALKNFVGFREKYSAGPQTLEDDFKFLGLQPNAPYRLAEMAIAFWRVHLQSNPAAVLEKERFEEVWARVEAHFKEQLTKPIRADIPPR